MGKYRSLYTFKAKFQPSWEDRYLIVSEGQALPQTFLALARAHGSGWWSMLKEAWVTVCPVKTMMKSVARLLRTRWLAVEKHEEQGKSPSENDLLKCDAEVMRFTTPDGKPTSLADATTATGS